MKTQNPRNYVAKHMRSSTRPGVHRDRKKAQRAGYRKHRGSYA